MSNYDVLVAAEEAYALLGQREIYTTTGKYLYGLTQITAPTVGSVGGEWLALGLTRSGYTVTEEYYQNVAAHIQAKLDDQGRLSPTKSTENSRIILALTAAGYDVTDVGGGNLLTALEDIDYVCQQGVNGPIWALIALDSHQYPAGDTTRRQLIDAICQERLADGGWAMEEDTADADLTAMAIQALAPYAQTDPQVQAVVEQALSCLSALQKATGDFGSCESCAQVLVALTVAGIDPVKDERFVKNGHTVVEALCAYYLGQGQFAHSLGGEENPMSTEQAYYALTAYFRLQEGKTTLYDMTDVTIQVDPCKPFTDINRSAWYHPYVDFVVANGLILGYGNTHTFAPAVNMSRAEFVTLLYRYDTQCNGGETVSAADCPFTDVTGWQVEGVTWAAAAKITTGVSATEFNPTGLVTRQEAATFLYRYARWKGYEAKAAVDLTEKFPADGSTVSNWAVSAMSWAAAEDVAIFAGDENGRLAPAGSVRRDVAAKLVCQLDGFVQQQG